jgi:hypothetical protein
VSCFERRARVEINAARAAAQQSIAKVTTVTLACTSGGQA